MMPYAQPFSKRDLVIRVLKEHPDLSDRAIARLAGVVPATVAAAKQELELPPTTQRREASGRRARGRRPVPRQFGEEDQLDRSLSTRVYRLYAVHNKNEGGRTPLLYVGRSIPVPEQTPWFDEISTIHVAHCRTVAQARETEKRAIDKEYPIYNTVANKQLTQEECETLREEWRAKRKAKREHAAARIKQRISTLRRASPETQREVALQLHAKMRQQAEARGKPAIPRPKG